MVETSIDIDKSLREIENFLRDNIVYILKNKYGDEWEKHLGVTKERLEIWNNRMQEERKRLNHTSIENRKIYYADFYDIKTIIMSNWDIFSNCFPKKNIIELQLEKLESFRNPNAHNRDLLDYQKHLLLGYIGEIKNGIMKYRGDIEKISTYFPQYESMNINGEMFKESWAHLDSIFRCGDQIEVSLYVMSPNTHKIYYALCDSRKLRSIKWGESNHFTIFIDEKDYGQIQKIIYFKSDSNYHINNNIGFDGLVTITYTVVPRNDN